MKVLHCLSYPLIVFLFITNTLSEGAKAQSLDEQERCAAQAKKAYGEWESDDKTSSKQFGGELLSGDYQSHYNTKLKKCLMLIESTRNLGNSTSNDAVLTDAYERRIYAYYLWMTRDGKKYWEVPPSKCDLIPSARPKEKKNCATRDEFDDFVADYMEE